ncbi:MAG TPA: flagellar basal-body MS-ring/collar protein FliF [Bacillota bacterium]
MEAVRERVQQIWGRLGAWQRAALISAAVLVAVAAAVAYGGRGEEFAPLFSELEPADAGNVVARLDEEGVSYRFSEDGTTILVPADQVHRLRLMLAAEGLPTGGVVGMEIMDQFQFGATEFERRMNRLRALQGELTRTIREVEGVEDARVHIVLPEESLFVSQQQPASAAVLVRMKPGHTLDAEQVAAITYLVAGSVEGLDPQAVTIVDSSGAVLSSPGGGTALEPVPGTLTNLEIQQQFQQQLQQSVESLLEQVFGPGNVVARVTAELNFDESVIDRELFEPADPEGLLRSVQELEERFEGTGQPAAIPGTDANLAIPTYAAGGANQDATYERSEAVRNFELNEIREHIVVAPGTVRRLSVSVVINDDNLSTAQIDAVRSTVAAAIGLDPGRSDQISVMGMAFDTSVADSLRESLAAEEEAARRAQRNRLYAYGAAAGLVLILGLVAWLSVRRTLRRRHEEEVLRRRLEAEIARRQEAVSVEDDETENARRELETLARQRPEQVAQIVRAWLVQE